MVTIALLGPGDMTIVLVLGLLLFGPKELPKIARQLGKTMRDFQHMADDARRSISLDDFDTLDHHNYSSGAMNPYTSAAPPEDIDAFHPAIAPTLSEPETVHAGESVEPIIEPVESVSENAATPVVPHKEENHVV